MVGSPSQIQTFFLVIVLGCVCPNSTGSEIRGVTIEGKAPVQYIQEKQGKSWAVTIGIDDYPNLPRLSYAVADAQAMARMLARQGFDVTPLYDKQATRRSILRELGRDLLMRVRPEDRVVVFFAGHGETENLGGGHPMGYMMPQDSEPDLLAGTAISMGLIRELSDAIPAKQVLFLIDICYGGIAGRRFRSLAPTTQEYLQVITREPARQLITAGGPGQKALEGPEWNHSVFTYYLLEALEKGYGDLNSDGIIPASELFTYLDEHVQSASLIRNHVQRPEMWTLTAANGEFVFIPEKASPNMQLVQASNENDKMRDAEAGTIETFERLLKKLEQRLEAFEEKVPPSKAENNDKSQGDKQVALETQQKQFELESQKLRMEQQQREKELEAQLVEAREKAAEVEQQRRKAAEQARQEQEAQLAQQQAALQAEQQRLAAQDKLRQEELARKEQELREQAAKAQQLAQEAEQARLATEAARQKQEAQLAQQQAALQAEQQRLAAQDRLRQEELTRKEQELQEQAAKAQQLAQEAEQARQSAERARQEQEAQLAQQQAALQTKQQRLAAQDKVRQEELARKEQELQEQAAKAQQLAKEAEATRRVEEQRLAQEQAALQAQQQQRAAQEQLRQEELARQEQELQKQTTLAQQLAKEAEATRRAEEQRLAQEQAALQAQQQQRAAQEQLRQEELARQEQELQKQADEAQRLAAAEEERRQLEAEATRHAEEQRVAQEQAALQAQQQQRAAQEQLRQEELARQEQELRKEAAEAPQIAAAENEKSSDQQSGFFGFFRNIFQEDKSKTNSGVLTEPTNPQEGKSNDRPSLQKDQPSDSQPQPLLEARLRPQDLPQKVVPQIAGSDGAPMVFIPSGTFHMGSAPEDITKVLDSFQGVSFETFQNELPLHRVDLPDYYIDQFEISVKLYENFLKATDRSKPKFWGNERFRQPEFPVVGVTWFDAKEYCTWAGKRLPSEAEWEKAARGSEKNVYPWGMTWDYTYSNTAGFWAKKTFSAMWYWAEWIEKALEQQEAGPLSIGKFPNGASPYGVQDMAGNVSEWVSDWYAPYEEQAIIVKNPSGNESGTLKLHRGGSWSVSSVFARSSYRARDNPQKESPYIGFRCAKSS